MKFLDIFEDIYSVLRFLPSGDYSINKIGELTGHHWETVQDMSKMIAFIQNMGIRLLIDNNDSKRKRIEITNYLLEDLELDPTFFKLIYLYLNKAVNIENAVALKMDKNIKNAMLEKNYIKKFNRKTYLTPKGIDKALSTLETLDELHLEKNAKIPSSESDFFSCLESEVGDLFSCLA